MGLGQFIYDYQTLIAGTVAIGAAYIAAHPVWRQLKLNQTQANGVLREMLIDRESELQKAKTAVSEKIGRPLNDLDFDIGFDGPPQKLTEHEAHHHDLGISQAVSWLRIDYPWRDSAKAAQLTFRQLVPPTYSRASSLAICPLRHASPHRRRLIATARELELVSFRQGMFDEGRFSARIIRKLYCHLSRSHYARKLIPFSPVEMSTAALRADSAPLFEEERHALRCAMVADFTCPIDVHRPCAWTAFATSNHPVDSTKINFAHRPNERLNR